MNPGTRGLIPALVRTPVGDMFVLTDDQKKSIEEQTEKVIDDLKKEIDRARERLDSILEKQLSDEQRDRIDEVFPGIRKIQFFKT